MQIRFSRKTVLAVLVLVSSLGGVVHAQATSRKQRYNTMMKTVQAALNADARYLERTRGPWRLPGDITVQTAYWISQRHFQVQYPSGKGSLRRTFKRNEDGTLVDTGDSFRYPRSGGLVTHGKEGTYRSELLPRGSDDLPLFKEIFQPRGKDGRLQKKREYLYDNSFMEEKRVPFPEGFIPGGDNARYLKGQPHVTRKEAFAPRPTPLKGEKGK